MAVGDRVVLITAAGGARAWGTSITSTQNNPPYKCESGCAPKDNGLVGTVPPSSAAVIQWQTPDMDTTPAKPITSQTSLYALYTNPPGSSNAGSGGGNGNGGSYYFASSTAVPNGGKSADGVAVTQSQQSPGSDTGNFEMTLTPTGNTHGAKGEILYGITEFTIGFAKTHTTDGVQLSAAADLDSMSGYSPTPDNVVASSQNGLAPLRWRAYPVGNCK